MKKIEVKVRYLFEGTYTVAADDRNEARTMVTRDCGLVLGGNIHTTLDDDEVDWEFDVHPDMQILSYTDLEKEQKPKHLKMDFSDRIETLRKDIIDAIRQLLYSHGLTEITFPEEQYDPVWVIWFDNNADPFECMVTYKKVGNNESQAFGVWQQLSESERTAAFAHTQRLQGDLSLRSYLYVYLRDKEWMKAM